MQRLDLGIAMCHFELTAQELSLKGRWIVQEPPIEKPQEVSSRDNLMEYIASWVEVE